MENVKHIKSRETRITTPSFNNNQHMANLVLPVMWTLWNAHRIVGPKGVPTWSQGPLDMGPHSMSPHKAGGAGVRPWRDQQPCEEPVSLKTCIRSRNNDSKPASLTTSAVSQGDTTYPQCDIRTIHLLGFFPKTPKPILILRKNIRQIQTEEHSTKHLTALFKTAKVMKNKESLRNCHRLEETKETDN